MAGLAAGWGRWGQPRGDVYKPVEEPQQQQRQPGIDTAPQQPKPRKMQFAYNTGDRTAPRPNYGYRGIMGGQASQPQTFDPFRTYGTVQEGRVIPPANPFAEPPGIRYTPGGEWGGGGPGPINTGPSQLFPIRDSSPTNNMPFNPILPGSQNPRSRTPPAIPPFSLDPNQQSQPIHPFPGMPYENPWLARGGFTGGQMPPSIGSETSGMMGGGMFSPGRPQRQPFGGGRMSGGLRGMYR